VRSPSTQRLNVFKVDGEIWEYDDLVEMINRPIPNEQLEEPENPLQMVDNYVEFRVLK
jgi:hypothetical protein